MSRPRFFELMPALYRRKDFGVGQLEAFADVLEGPFKEIEADIAALYANWFADTCDPWVLPYIGDLLGITVAQDSRRRLPGVRALVANRTAYARRKAVPQVLANALRDVTGWSCQVVELGAHLVRSTSVRRADHAATTADLRDMRLADTRDGPFDTCAHVEDLRRPSSNPDESLIGRYGRRHVGVFVWRIQSQPIGGVDAKRGEKDHQFYIHPLGKDSPLFGAPRSNREVWSNVEREDVAAPLPPSVVAQEHDARTRDDERFYLRPNPAAMDTSRIGHPTSVPRPPYVESRRRRIETHFLESGREAFRLHKVDEEGRIDDIPLEHLVFRDLSGWPAPASDSVELDLERGRVQFPANGAPSALLTSHHYGFSADIGGGPYDRRDGLTVPTADTWKALVGRGLEPRNGGSEVFDSLDDALGAYAQELQSQDEPGAYPPAVIRIVDSRTYTVEATKLSVGTGGLTIEAADGQRPCIDAPRLEVAAAQPTPTPTFRLNGLLWRGSITVREPLRFEVVHCTIVAVGDGAAVIGLVKDVKVFAFLRLSIPLVPPGADIDLAVLVERSIVGPMILPASTTGVTVRDSILDPNLGDNENAAAIAGPGSTYGPATTFERSTVLGRLQINAIPDAVDTIFARRVQTRIRDWGMLRYCYVAADSETPPPFACEEGSVQLSTMFTSVEYGDPAYGQLGSRCPETLSTGATDGGQMGAFNLALHQRRIEQLQAVLADHLPYHLSPVVIFAS